MIVLSAFLYDFFMEIWTAKLLRYGILMAAVFLELVYFLVLIALRY